MSNTAQAQTATPPEDARTGTAIIPPPPRRTGDTDRDTEAAFQWFQSFFEATVRESGLLDPSFQADVGSEQIGPGRLPNPARSTIAKAQATANVAVRAMRSGEVRFVDNTLAMDFDFDVPFPDDNYTLVGSSQTIGGNPAAASGTVRSVTKRADGATIQLMAAPGLGSAITIGYIAMRSAG